MSAPASMRNSAAPVFGALALAAHGNAAVGARTVRWLCPRRQRVEHALPQKLSVTEDRDRAALEQAGRRIFEAHHPKRMRAGVRHAAIGANQEHALAGTLRLTSSTMVALSSAP